MNILRLKQFQSQGFTLLEVMIAMVVFSIGLLGLAGLQALGIQNNQTAFNRTIAMQQAYNMVDRMRNNVDAVIAGSYSFDSSVGTVTDCNTTACNAATIAASDKNEWNTNNKTLLPQGRGIVFEDPTQTNRYVVCVMWNELKIPTASLVEPDCIAAYDPKTNYKFYTVRTYLKTL